MGQSTKTIAAFKQKMTTLAVHDYAPLIAAGSEDQCLRIFADGSEMLKDIRYHDGFMGRRIGSVASVAFHPHALFVAAGATDSIVSVRLALPRLASSSCPLVSRRRAHVLDANRSLRYLCSHAPPHVTAVQRGAREEGRRQ